MTGKYNKPGSREKRINMSRRRKNSAARQKRRLLIYGAAGIAAAAVIAVAVPLLQKRQTAVYGETQLQRPESGGAGADAEGADRKPQQKVIAEGIDISGLSKEEAAKVLSEKFSGPVKVQGPDETVELRNPVEAEIARILESAPGQAEEVKLSFDYERMEQDIREQAAGLADKWDQKPVDSNVVSYNKETGIYEYSKDRNGRNLDQDNLVTSIMRSVREGDYKSPVEASFSITPPARTQAQAKAQYQVIGTFTTKLTNNKNRNKNVTLAAEAIDGLILKPGEEFSFNNTTGNRTKEKGYQPAGAYRNGVLIEEPGGGVCQVSTTLYHSIIEAGFKTTERNAHSFAPSYVEKGQDAMVSFDGYAGPDLKFVNTSAAPVVLRATVSGLELKLSIVGIPVLDDGVKVSIRSEKVRDAEPTAPSYEENTQLPFGTEKIVDQGQNGSVWKSFRVLTKDGQVLKEEPLHNSYYKSKAGVIQRNTTFPQIEETAGAAESAGAADSEGAAGTQGGDVQAPEPEQPEAAGPAGPAEEAAETQVPVN